MRPPGPYRMPPAGRDGVMRRCGGGLVRLLHLEEEAVIVHAWPTRDAVRLRAAAPSRVAALHGLDRIRFGLALDLDLAPFHRRFAHDRLLGPLVRRLPWLRPARRPEPFEALAWAITEQLIESEHAAMIQRRLVRRYGRRSSCGSFADVPSAAILAARAPVELEACGLSAGRSTALVRVAREVAAGRADLARHEPSWRRLGKIRGIGPWTLEYLALHGQGRGDQLPAGDLAYLKLVGDLKGLGRRATEEQVRAFFAPYAPYAGLAGTHLVRGRHLLEVPRRGPRRTRAQSLRGPARAGARW